MRPTCAPLNAGRRKSSSGSIGSRDRASAKTNAARSATAPASDRTIDVLLHPSSFPRSSAKTSRNRPPVSVAWPGRSSRRARDSFDSRTQAEVAAIVRMPSGTLTKNTARQLT